MYDYFHHSDSFRHQCMCRCRDGGGHHVRQSLQRRWWIGHQSVFLRGRYWTDVISIFHASLGVLDVKLFKSFREMRKVTRRPDVYTYGPIHTFKILSTSLHVMILHNALGWVIENKRSRWWIHIVIWWNLRRKLYESIAVISFHAELTNIIYPRHY